jgi:hypothetical protein
MIKIFYSHYKKKKLYKIDYNKHLRLTSKSRILTWKMMRVFQEINKH